MKAPGSRPASFERLRRLPGVGRALDWGMGAGALSPPTASAGARSAGLKVTELICPYCAVGCGQVVYTRDGELVDIEGNPRCYSSWTWAARRASSTCCASSSPGRR